MERSGPVVLGEQPGEDEGHVAERAAGRPEGSERRQGRRERAERQEAER